MPHHPQPFFRSAWFLQLHGKQIKLGVDRDGAFRRYHELMAQGADSPPPPPAAESTASETKLRLCVEWIDSFLDWWSPAPELNPDEPLNQNTKQAMKKCRPADQRELMDRVRSHQKRPNVVRR